MKNWKLVTTSAAILGIAGTPAYADGADDLQDMIGARAGQAEMGVQRRGYEHVETHQAGSVSSAYWWNEEADDCVLIRTSDGRYQSITDASDQDCGHHEGNAAGAAVVVGIGAALVAALASNHHHQDDHGDHDSDSRDYRAQYDRGFSDGLHNASYHNYDRSDGYSNGYDAGVQQRDHNLRHRRGRPNRGGYHQSVNVSDLNGARAAGAMRELERRGFRQVDNFTSGNTRYSIQWRADSRQCVQATIAEGRIYDIRDIGSNPGCR